MHQWCKKNNREQNKWKHCLTEQRERLVEWVLEPIAFDKQISWGGATQKFPSGHNRCSMKTAQKSESKTTKRQNQERLKNRWHWSLRAALQKPVEGSPLQHTLLWKEKSEFSAIALLQNSEAWALCSCDSKKIIRMCIYYSCLPFYFFLHCFLTPIQIKIYRVRLQLKLQCSASADTLAKFSCTLSCPHSIAAEDEDGEKQKGNQRRHDYKHYSNQCYSTQGYGWCNVF